MKRSGGKLPTSVERVRKRQAKDIAKAKAPTEAEMRDAPDPSPNSVDELSGLINSLVDRPHDYGTCVYAMSLAAVAAFNYVASRLGVTGFQASCADMDFLRRTRGMNQGFKILNAENLLYPQYDLLGDTQKWIAETLPTLADEAKKRLAGRNGATGAVIEHWQRIASGAS